MNIHRAFWCLAFSLLLGCEGRSGPDENCVDRTLVILDPLLRSGAYEIEVASDAHRFTCKIDFDSDHASDCSPEGVIVTGDINDETDELLGFGAFSWSDAVSTTVHVKVTDLSSGEVVADQESVVTPQLKECIESTTGSEQIRHTIAVDVSTGSGGAGGEGGSN